MTKWARRFAGMVGDRYVESFVDEDSMAGRVVTTQRTASADPSTRHVMNAGARIDIMADTLDELQSDLRENEFTAEESAEILRVLRSPVP